MSCLANYLTSDLTSHLTSYAQPKSLFILPAARLKDMIFRKASRLGALIKNVCVQKAWFRDTREDRAQSPIIMRQKPQLATGQTTLTTRFQPVGR